MMSAGPGPGFYADTTAPGRERYWDGSQWTDHFRPASGPAQTGPTFIAPATPVVEDAAGGIVVTGYIFAVLMPIVGFVLGIVAVTRPAKATSRHGVWIIVASVVAFIVWWAILTSGSSTSGGSYSTY
jgi:hypothetical protein